MASLMGYHVFPTGPQQAYPQSRCLLVTPCFFSKTVDGLHQVDFHLRRLVITSSGSLWSPRIDISSVLPLLQHEKKANKTKQNTKKRKTKKKSPPSQGENLHAQIHVTHARARDTKQDTRGIV